MAKAKKSPLGERLKIALKAAGVKAKDVAAKIGVPERAFYNWTMGIREPKITILEKIVREFNINPNYILLGEGPPVLPRGSKKKVSSEEERDLRQDHREFVILVENAYNDNVEILKALNPEVPLVSLQKFFYISMERFLKLYPKFMYGEGGPVWVGRGLRAILLAANLSQPLPDNRKIREAVASIIIVSSLPFSKWKKVFPDVFEKIDSVEDLLSHLNKIKRKDRISFCKFFEKRARIGDYLPLVIKNASVQLFRLAEEGLLPLFCCLHEKVFWTSCPLCSQKQETEQKEYEEEGGLPPELSSTEGKDQELYTFLIQETEEKANEMEIKLEKDEKIQIHKEILENMEKEKENP